MKGIFGAIILLLVVTGCTGTQQREDLDGKGNYEKERYLTYEDDRVRVRGERSSLKIFSKDEVLPYIAEGESGENHIGLEIKRHKLGGKGSLKLMTIIADEDEYTYYLLFERSHIVKRDSGEVVEEFDIEIDERLLERLSSAREIRVKFTDYKGERNTVVVNKKRRISYRLIYEEYLKKKGA